MLVPMYFLIAIWGHENRIYAADQVLHLHAGQRPADARRASSASCFVHGAAPASWSFDYFDLLARRSRPGTRDAADARLLRGLRRQAARRAAAHLAARRAHGGADRGQRDPGRAAAEDGRLRADPLRRCRCFPRPPRASRRSRWRWASPGILYGAVLAFGQTDLKRLVAYTSVSHLGFVLLGIFAWNQPGAAGRGHADARARRQHRRACSSSPAPCRSACTRATCDDGRALGRRAAHGRRWRCSSRSPRSGCPASANFVGEFLVLLGTFARSAASTRPSRRSGLVERRSTRSS